MPTIMLAGPRHTAKCPNLLRQVGLIFMQCLSARPHDSRMMARGDGSGCRGWSNYGVLPGPTSLVSRASSRLRPIVISVETRAAGMAADLWNGTRTPSAWIRFRPALDSCIPFLLEIPRTGQNEPKVVVPFVARVLIEALVDPRHG